MDKDGLVFCGRWIRQVTWMDVRVGDLVVTQDMESGRNKCPLV